MNILTIEMFHLRDRIKHLEWLHKCDPNDYMIEFELTELKWEYSNLKAIELRKTFKVVQGGAQSTKPSTPFNTKVV